MLNKSKYSYLSVISDTLFKLFFPQNIILILAKHISLTKSPVNNILLNTLQRKAYLKRYFGSLKKSEHSYDDVLHHNRVNHRDLLNHFFHIAEERRLGIMPFIRK
jgi:hypothetical protein